jgi:hypothetical protein
MNFPLNGKNILIDPSLFPLPLNLIKKNSVTEFWGPLSTPDSKIEIVILGIRHTNSLQYDNNVYRNLVSECSKNCFRVDLISMYGTQVLIRDNN